MNINSSKWQEKLERDGHAILDNFLSEEQIDNLKNSYHQNLPEDLSSLNLSHSMASSNLAYRKQVSLCIKNSIEKQLKSLLPQYRISHGFFFAKKPQTINSEIKIHQHPMSWNENVFPNCYHIWAPLVDVSEHNGCLQFITGTHKLRRYAIATETIKSEYINMTSDRIVSVPMKVGQAIIFNSRIWHGSFPNMSDTERVGFFANLYHVNATPYHYQPNNFLRPTEYEIFEVSNDFCLEVIYSSDTRQVTFPQNKIIKSIGKINCQELLPWSKKEILETIYSQELNSNSQLVKNLKITTKILLLNSKQITFRLRQKLKNYLAYNKLLTFLKNF